MEWCSVSLLCNIQLVYLYIITSHPVLSLPFLLVFSSLFSEFCQLNSMRFALPKYCMLLAGVNTLQIHSKAKEEVQYLLVEFRATVKAVIEGAAD